jgi:hypothetical protein
LLRRGDCEISILHDKMRYFYDENSSCDNDLRGGDGNICTDRTSMNAEEVRVHEEKTTVSSSGGGANNNTISNNRGTSTTTKWTMRSNDNKRRRRIFKEISFLKDLSPKPMPQSHSTTRSPSRTVGQDIDSIGDNIGDIDGCDGPISRDPFPGRFTDSTRHHKGMFNKGRPEEEEEEEKGSDGKGSSDHRDRSFTLSGM